MSIYVGLDPSFSSVGLSMMDTDKRIVYLRKIDNHIGKDKSFINIYHKSVEVSKRVVGEIQKVSKEVDCIISEEPFPHGHFSSGLFALDSVLILILKTKFSSVTSFYTVHTSFLKHVHGRKGTKKSDSVKLAKEYLQIFREQGYDVDYSGKFTHDMAESFMIMCRLFVLNGTDKKCGKLLTDRSIGLASEKERVVYQKLL